LTSLPNTSIFTSCHRLKGKMEKSNTSFLKRKKKKKEKGGSNQMKDGISV